VVSLILEIKAKKKESPEGSQRKENPNSSPENGPTLKQEEYRLHVPKESRKKNIYTGSRILRPPGRKNMSRSCIPAS